MAREVGEPRERMALDPEACDAFVQQTTMRLARGNVAVLVVDLGRVRYASPRALSALEAVAQASGHVGADLRLEGVRPEVYKALHVTGLANRFTRIVAGDDAA